MLGPMMGRETTGAPGAVAQPLFATTHWSVVLATADQDSPQAAAALEQLCRTYWYPLYAYVRRRGYSHEDAQDLTQGFFAHLLRKALPARRGPGEGPVPLVSAGGLKHYLTDEWDKASAARRGGAGPNCCRTGGEAEERRNWEATAPS